MKNSFQYIKLKTSAAFITALFTQAAYCQTPANYHLVWHDEFNYTGLPDPSKWRYETGFVRNQEPQFYTEARAQNARVENGLLVIEAIKEKFKGQTQSGKGPKDTIAAYTSASIYTQGINSWQYGRVEVRAKVFKGLGSWSAAWLLGDTHGQLKWPLCGEIDLMEYVGKDSTKVYGTVHYTDSSGKHRSQGKKPILGTPYDGFHIYAIEWNENHIDFYYDKAKYFSFDVKDADVRGENIFRKKFYVLLNLALGRPGTLGGPLNKSILPLRYEVDYVRVYQ